MSIVAFRNKPNDQDSLSAVYALSAECPAWAFEFHRSDDGQPYVTAENDNSSTVLGAHWSPKGWGVLSEAGELVSHSPNLRTALKSALC